MPVKVVKRDKGQGTRDKLKENNRGWKRNYEL
jgi:hypothetical protein